MPCSDSSTRAAYAQLSQAEPDTPFTVSRRRFLQGLLAAGAGATLSAAVPGWAREAFAATPLGANDGVLVVLLMAGGNDALNTLVPYTDGRYFDLRGPAALDPAAVLPLDGKLALHPALGYLKRLYEAGNVAIVQGVGYPQPDLSHFVSMATWMRGWGGNGAPQTGWLGRWLDHLGKGGSGPDPLHALQLGSAVPLHLIGAERRAASVGVGMPFGASTHAWDVAVYNAMADFASSSTGLGAYGDLLARTQLDLLEVARRVAPVYGAPLPQGRLVDRLTLAARLINADLGARVLSLSWGDFDSHDGVVAMHGSRMAELDAALASFFAELAPAFADRVTVLTFSEFGRRPATNGNQGTDHGTAGVQLLIGNRVRGGLYGEMPSLQALNSGQLTATMEFGSVYATVLERWLGADADAVLGRSYERLPLFAAGPSAPPPPPAPGPTAPAELIAVTPLRRLDTRVGMGAARAPLAGGQHVDVLVAGTGDIPPEGATAVVLNVTAVSPSSSGFLTVWPAGEARPLASNLNFTPGQVVPNLVVCKIGARGMVSILNSAGATDVVADVVGYFRSGGGTAMVPVQPTRLLDTRTPGRAPLGPGGSHDLAVTGGEVPADAPAVVLNVTVTEPTAVGYLTVHPAGADRPLASNLNFIPGQTVPNLVVAKVGAGGAVRLFNSNGTAHVIVDLLGYVTPSAGSAGRVVALTPARLVDTREAGGALAAGEERVITLAGKAGLPAAGAFSGVIANVTITEPAATGFATLWRADRTRPLASNLNFVAGQTVPNLVLAAASPDGRVKVMASQRAHVVVDVIGYLTA